MDTARYYAAVLLVISIPPAFLFWFLVHPWPGFWRRLGVAWSYTLLFGAMIVAGWGLFLVRRPLVGADLGTSWPLIGLAVILYGLAIALYIKRRKLLTNKVLVGLPEIAPERHPQPLLTEGIYGVVRHPRYIEVVIGFTAWACFANYVGAYTLCALMLPVLWITVLLEERELLVRYGEEYERYRQRVPRFVPRRRRG